jgi:hypothetical protein
MLWKQDHETGRGMGWFLNYWTGDDVHQGGTQGPLVQPDQFRPGQHFEHMVAHLAVHHPAV